MKSSTWIGGLRSAAFLAALILLWVTAYRSRHWSPLLLPSPAEVKTALVDGWKDHTFPTGILASMKRMVAGYALSVFIGLPIGVLLARFAWARQTLGTMVQGLQALPSICWVPLSILWFGLDEKAILFVVVMGSVGAVATATAGGLQTISPSLLAAGQTLGARGFTLYRRVLLPAALPPVLTGLKLGWSFAWRSLMAGELIVSTVGLGGILESGRDNGDMGTVIAAMIVIVALGLLVEALIFNPIERRLHRRWGLAGATA